MVERDGKRLDFTVVPAREKDGIGTAGWLVEADVVISQVDPQLGAQKAGLKPGDVLISADGQQIRSMLKLQNIIQKSEGQPVSLTVSRDEQLMHFSVVPQKSAGRNMADRRPAGSEIQAGAASLRRGVRSNRCSGTRATSH